MVYKTWYQILLSVSFLELWSQWKEMWKPSLSLLFLIYSYYQSVATGIEPAFSLLGEFSFILIPAFSLHNPICYWKLLLHQLHIILPLFGTELWLFQWQLHFHFKASLQECFAIGGELATVSMWACPFIWSSKFTNKLYRVLFLQEALHSKNCMSTVFITASGG